jgi:hypothetical protein
VITTGSETYRWLASPERKRPSHAFVNGDPHSLCLTVVRHPMAAGAWAYRPDRRPCKRCMTIVALWPDLREVRS